MAKYIPFPESNVKSSGQVAQRPKYTSHAQFVNIGNAVRRQIGFFSASKFMKLRHAIRKIKVVLLELPKMGIGQDSSPSISFLSSFFLRYKLWESKLTLTANILYSLCPSGPLPTGITMTGPSPSPSNESRGRRREEEGAESRRESCWECSEGEEEKSLLGAPERTLSTQGILPPPPGCPNPGLSSLPPPPPPPFGSAGRWRRGQKVGLKKEGRSQQNYG